ncbi:thioredoxin domain-containing protein 16-like [Panulirus ornatus]|uniref:thioredoxin domain-containing protein 16-like n=1 Tax=Panulirus ornatus TaxID=150431 RepID=UPI003A83CB6E
MIELCLQVCCVVLCTDPNQVVTSAIRDHPHHGNTNIHNEHIHSQHDFSFSQACTDQYQSTISDETVCSQPDRTCEIHKIPKYSDTTANEDRFPRTENEVSVSDIDTLHDRLSSQIPEWETLDQESKGTGISGTDDEQSQKDPGEITNELGNSFRRTLFQDGSNREEITISVEEDEECTAEGDGNTEDAVRILHQVGDFENFLEKGAVVIVYFYRESGSDALSRFLSEYSKSAEHLLQYDVLLARVNCAEYNVATYCLPDKVNRFAYGFRGGQEKIAFPLDTLFNNNAIVASALHLALINSVPILQTSGERRDLEARCRGRCDIIFSFLHTLGTFEHRMFLEVAYAHQDSFVFAITTYTAGTLGLSDTRPDEERENTLWVVHCADKEAGEECVVSHYRHRMEHAQLLQFIHALQLPMWHELALLPTTPEVVTPYDGSGLPWVLLLYDTSSRSRVRSLAPHLAQLLHGSVATITVSLEVVSEAALMKLGLARHTITAPAVAFLQPGKEIASLLNDYDDALEWVNEQLSAMMQQTPLNKEQSYLPVQALEELQQDDEVVLDMVKEDTFTSVPTLAGPDPYASALDTNTLSVFAFYLSWDPVSNALLQHLNAIASTLHDYGSQASLHRIHCFDWPNFCDAMGVSTYPVLRLHPKGRRNITYEGPIHGDYILKTILLCERATPLELVNNRELEGLLALNEDLHPGLKVTSSAAVGIFPSVKDSMAFTEASHILEGSHLMGRHISPHGVHTLCETNHGCVVVSKPGDKFQPRRVLNKEVDKPGVITRFVSHASLPVLAPLDPERYSALLAGVEKDEEHSPVSSQHLIILFLPANSSLPSLGGKEFESRKQTSQHQAQEERKPNKISKGVHRINNDDMWTIIGHLAAELSEPGFVFSWLLCDDPLATELLPVYGLSMEVWSLVGVSQREGIVYVFTGRNPSESAVRDWLNRLRGGDLQPSIKLPGREWEPRLPGFDYLKFMLEDQDRDAEDHLLLEMEADLSAHHHQEGSNERKKYSHEEL